ncbi:ABC transporter permease subunit [Sulfitobacter faviae]|uniref:ABC transporter permease subunit n=1 Tax=Sulfitobacter faviae TaxID=1775881 RepID=UPI0024575C8F|nr:hypothetical protein [Sulfitobacter faviae]
MSVLILRSGLGRSLTGVMHNEQRMRALGLTVWRVKADVFGLSGMIAGLAGALTAQHIMYISPGLLGWKQYRQPIYVYETVAGDGGQTQKVLAKLPAEADPANGCEMAPVSN